MNRKRPIKKPRRLSPGSELSESIVSYSVAKEFHTQKNRKDNSLVELTKNFIEYIRSESPVDHIIQISKMVKKLKVKKRRIYDITNVLEGIKFGLFKVLVISENLKRTKSGLLTTH
jgi:hypothetical protein